MTWQNLTEETSMSNELTALTVSNHVKRAISLDTGFQCPLLRQAPAMLHAFVGFEGYLMKRAQPFSLLLWLSMALSCAHATPPSFQDLQARPERALPMQPIWQLVPVDGPSTNIWRDIFTFDLGQSPQLLSRSRWIALNPDKNSSLSPALLDTLEGRVLSLSPKTRSFCDGHWQTAWLKKISINPALQPLLKVWLVERRLDGTMRTAIGFGRLDTQGQWAVPPVSCDGQDTATVDSPSAINSLLSNDSDSPPSDLRVDWVYAQPGLRNAQGRWLTPPPSQDIATARWMNLRQDYVAPGSTGEGVIDTRGRMVVPPIFGELPDATDQQRIRLCTEAWQRLPGDAHPPPACDWKQLPRSNTVTALRPVKATNTGRWGYQDASGKWVIEPQFERARPFHHGYAVVSDAIPEDWRPPGWSDGMPVIRKFHRVGRYWVAEAMVRNASTDGHWALRYGLLNDAAQWLAPIPVPPLHISVLFPPGGRSSHYAEMLAANLPQLLGRQVQIEHVTKPGEADYRRLMTEGGNAKALLAAIRLPRGGIKDVHQGPPLGELMQSLQPVTLLVSQPMVLVIDSTKADALGIHTTDDLLAYAQANPGALRIGTGEDGWTGQLAFGQFRALSGVHIQRVIYKSMYPDSDVITKDHAVDMLFSPVNGVTVAVRRGQLRVLGTTADPAHPQTFEGKQWPTLASNPLLSGYTTYDHFSLWAPASSDAESNRVLQKAVALVLAKPEVQKHLQEIQAVGGGGSPESLLETKEREDWMRALSSTLR